jgi:transposase
LIDARLAWGSPSKLEPFVRVARAIGMNRDSIDCALVQGLSNARVEGMNVRLRCHCRYPQIPSWKDGVPSE